MSAPFALGDEPALPSPARAVERGDNTVLGTSRPIKGVIGWTDETTLIVVGAGQDARWEKFEIQQEDGRSVLVREGWKKYLSN